MARFEYAPMARKKPKQFKVLHIGPWLTKLERKPSDVARQIGLNEGYLSQLISGEKKNPSSDVLLRLSEELGISINALYSRPPEMDVTSRVKVLRPEQLEALGALLDEFQKGRRRN